jgi:hypothetical protein
VLVALLAELNAAAPSLQGIVVAAVTIALLGLVAFVPPALLLAPTAAAAAGLALYAALLALVRPDGLLGGWRYLRALA